MALLAVIFLFEEHDKKVTETIKNKKHFLMKECFAEYWYVVKVSDTTMFNFYSMAGLKKY